MANFDIEEKETSLYKAIIQDENDVAIPAASLGTLTLTLYDKDTGDIINGRDGQNVLNTNDVTVDSSGNLQWTIQPDDSPIVTSTAKVEHHVALFQWTITATGSSGKHEVQLFVKNLTKVT